MGRRSHAPFAGDGLTACRSPEGAPPARPHLSEKRRVRHPRNVMHGLKMLRCRYLS